MKRERSSFSGSSKRRRYQGYFTGQVSNMPMELSRSRRRARMYRYSRKKDLYTLSNPTVDRFQGLTSFDTDGGYHRLSQYQNMLPIHIFDVTSFNNGNGFPGVAKALGWAQELANGDTTSLNLPGQDYLNSTNLGIDSLNWQHEYGKATDANNGWARRVNLKWLDLRFNLYGARNRDTRFKIQLVSFPEDHASLWTAANSAAQKKALLAALERPLLYNNLNLGDRNVLKWMKIHKSYTYDVPAMTSVDLNTVTGRIKEARIFIKVNKVMSLMWSLDGIHESHVLPEDGAEWRPQGIHQYQYQNHPIGPSRLFIVVSAFSPVKYSPPPEQDGGYYTPAAARTWAGSPGTPLNNNDEPSYDFIIRRKYQLCVGAHTMT